MQTPCSRLALSSFNFYSAYCNPSEVLLRFFSSVASPAYTRTKNPCSNPIIFNYLMETLAVPEPQALTISNRLPRIKTLDKPQSVVQFFGQLGFSDTQIRSSIRVTPQLLIANPDKTLKPKMLFFQELGLTGVGLGKFISKNSSILSYSLENTLIPCVDIIKKILLNDKNNEVLVRILRKCYWLVCIGRARLLCNIAFLESCGIVGSQLLMLLKSQPRLFVMRESALRDLLSRVLDMGFSINSRMLIHAVYTVSCLSNETFGRKLELLRCFGFSKDECMEMFRRTPGLLKTSEEKLRFGIEFFLNGIKFKRSVLVHQPHLLMYSIGDRVIPRYGVLQVLKSKRLLKKEPSFASVLYYSEGKFVEKFISRFRDDAEELLVAYKGHLLDT